MPAIADICPDATEAAKAVFQDLLTEGVAWEERLDTALAVYRTALAAYGYLTPPMADPTAELDETAVWLAQQSGFPRYCDGDGWRLLRATRENVEVAYRKASDLAHDGDRDLQQALSAARHVLSAHAANAFMAREPR